MIFEKKKEITDKRELTSIVQFATNFIPKIQYLEKYRRTLSKNQKHIEMIFHYDKTYPFVTVYKKTKVDEL